MQEAMQQMPMSTNPKAKQETKVTIKIKVQEELKDPYPKTDTNQMRRKNCPVEYAKSLHIQAYLGVQIKKNIYQASQMDQKVFPRKYADITWEISSVTAVITV